MEVELVFFYSSLDLNSVSCLEKYTVIRDILEDHRSLTLSQTDESGAIETYAYNSRQQLISHTVKGQTTTYAYNPEGIRTQQTSPSQSTDYLIDQNRDYAQVLAEYDSTGLKTLYSYGDDLVSQTKGTATHYYYYDGLGSTRALSDASGIVTDTYAYDAFGGLLSQTGITENHYRFTGEQYDAGLDQYYLRARYYDQGVGRFTQQDSWMGKDSDPITLHKYLYANGDGVNHVDPSGHFISLGSIGSHLSSARVYLTHTMINLGGRSGITPIGRILRVASIRTMQALLMTEVRRCFRTKGRDCRVGNIVVIGSSQHPESQAHIRDAITGEGSNGFPISPLLTYSKGDNSSRNWLRSTPECGGGKTGRALGLDCDEFPFATTTTGGQRFYNMNLVSLRPISISDNRSSGSLWGRATLANRNTNNRSFDENYLIVPYTEFSFYFSNGRFGF